MITLSDKQAEILHIIKDTTLTHEQTMMALAKAAENTLDYPDVPAIFCRITKSFLHRAANSCAWTRPRICTRL